MHRPEHRGFVNYPEWGGAEFLPKRKITVTTASEESKVQRGAGSL
jgi:hypothetical protein